jgi:hypothetical protein
MESQAIHIRFQGEENIEGNYLVTPLAGRHYRFDDAAFFAEGADYGDLIELDRSNDGTYRFVRVIEPSAFRRSDFLIPQRLVVSPRLQTLLDAVRAQGGEWIRVFGGVLAIYLPPTSTLDPEQAFSDMVGQERPG